MSVSITLLPIALVIRVAVGKDRFENWVKSSEIKVPTNLKSEKELVKIVKLSGYDCIHYAGLLKTHTGYNKDFITWEIVDGVWNLVFSKYDSYEMVKKFMDSIEREIGKTIFANDRERVPVTDETTKMGNTPPSLPKTINETFPTNFKDKELLIKTLKDYSVNTEEMKNGDIKCTVEGCELNFHKEGDSSYDVEIRGNIDLKSAYYHISVIDEEYKKSVQAYTYKKVIDKISGSSMSLESEEVLDDNSILLTVNIGE